MYIMKIKESRQNYTAAVFTIEQKARRTQTNKYKYPDEHALKLKGFQGAGGLSADGPEGGGGGGVTLVKCIDHM